MSRFILTKDGATVYDSGEEVQPAPVVVPVQPPAQQPSGDVKVVVVDYPSGTGAKHEKIISPGQILAYQFSRSQLVRGDPTRFQSLVTLNDAPLVKMALSATPGAFYDQVVMGTPQISGSNNISINYVTSQYYRLKEAIDGGYARQLPDGETIYLNVMLQPGQPQWPLVMFYG